MEKEMNDLYDQIIAILKTQKQREPSTERGRLLDIAIQQTVLAKSWAIKAMNYKNPSVEGSINKGVR